MTEQIQEKAAATSQKLAENTEEPAIQSSGYDIIRRRLSQQAEQLQTRAETLNKERQELFGSTTLAVIGQDRIRTENNCIPQDIINVGGRLLFGYNVFIGLKTHTAVDDVFSLHTFAHESDQVTLGHVPADHPTNFLTDPRFIKDFEDLYTYYKDTHLQQLRRVGNKLLAVFQIGSALTDVRVLRWAILPNNQLKYLDNSGAADNTPPPPHDFLWTTAGRDAHVQGKHPHINICDKIFVETVGGDLTIKIEDNTEDGLGIYREPVEDQHQSLGDATIQYAALGNLILLKILPYRETTFRYFAFNTVTEDIARIDAIGQSCIQLPEDHGIIFPGGYVLADGERRKFDADITGMRFAESIRSPNGEDVLYVFYRPTDGHYILLAYNLIRKEVQTPIHCHGYSVFDDGTMIVFRAMSDEPTRVHPMQIWHTPFTSDEFAASQPTDGGFLSRVGNADLVRGISDALTIVRMIANQQPTVAVYESLIASTQRMHDAYFWLPEKQAQNLAAILTEISNTSELIIDEFIKVTEQKKQATKALEEIEQRQRDLLRDIRYHDWKELERFIEALGGLRTQRGRLITLRETRYINLARLGELEAEIVEHNDKLSRSTVNFLLGDQALVPYRTSIEKLTASIQQVDDTLRARELREKLDEIGEGLTLLTEVVSGLKVEDPNARTQILEQISEILGLQNRARAMLDARRRELLDQEGRAEFGVQFQLFSQSVTSAVNMADTPDRCDEMLTRTIVQLEELETRFSEFDQFLAQLSEKRDDVYEIFENRKQQLLEEQQRQAHNTAQAAERILSGISRRTARLKSLDEVNAFFAADAMILKVGETIERLRALEDPMRADDIQTKLRTLRDESIRALRDKLDLFEDGQNVIRFGTHRFSVSNQSTELTMVARDQKMTFHITGTDYFEQIDDPDFNKTSDLWNQHLVSESPDVYRAEFLAATILFDAETGQNNLTIPQLYEARLKPDTDKTSLAAIIRETMQNRYDEGYERGVHDTDATEILNKIITMYTNAGLLRFSPPARALATIFWAHHGLEHFHETWTRRAQSFGRLRKAFEHAAPLRELGLEFAKTIEQFARDLDTTNFPTINIIAQEAGHYLAEELSLHTIHNQNFVASAAALTLRDEFYEYLDATQSRPDFDEDLARLQSDLKSRYELITGWLSGAIARHNSQHERVLTEAVALILTQEKLHHTLSTARISTTAENLLGQHPRITQGTMTLHLDEFISRLRAYITIHVPRYREYRRLTQTLVETNRHRLRLDELKPRVLSTFVRNRLIDEVYLPLLGNNFAKQLGALASQDGSTQTQSDRSGLLLLISPPGYGKTTLMEYVASRLGLVFMSISGPSLGHTVSSLDPNEAPNATSRQEVEKINLALEMGNNVMLYLDDIQHTNPELLQKFISLCDATRRIEGVWNGRTRTYDMRGKRFAVVMAGNPYTETGERFQIPDMLANRADTYNLGDILDGREDAFAMSYIENALTSNPVLAPLANRERADLDRFLRMAHGQTIPLTDFAHDYSASEAAEIVSILKKLIVVQKTLLKVNQLYITSASQDDNYRTEPPFKLQGSYRNMARLTARVAAAMNPTELEALIDDHYIGEAQTLTTGAEQNLLKLAEIRGRLTPETHQRWESIKLEFVRRRMMGGSDNDPINRVAGPLSSLATEFTQTRTLLERTFSKNE